MPHENDYKRVSHYAGRKVRLTIPAEVAFDLDRFQTAVKNLAEELGCLPCLSGASCTFRLVEELVSNPAGEVRDAIGLRFRG